MSKIGEQIVSELKPVIADAAKAAVTDAGTTMTPNQVKAVTKEVSAVVVNQTNQEPFYQSTVTIGALITIIGGGYGFILNFTDGTIPDGTEFTAMITPLIGAVVTLYGRWIRKTPLGS